MNKFLSYCGLVDSSISASEKDLPVNKTAFEPKPTEPNLIGNAKSQIISKRLLVSPNSSKK